MITYDPNTWEPVKIAGTVEIVIDWYDFTDKTVVVTNPYLLANGGNQFFQFVAGRMKVTYFWNRIWSQTNN